MDRKNITIVSLSATAVILLVLLVLFHWVNTPKVVLAGSMEARGGDYVATMGQIATDAEALYLLDARSRTMGIYLYDNNTKQVELRRTIMLLEKETLPQR